MNISEAAWQSIYLPGGFYLIGGGSRVPLLTAQVDRCCGYKTFVSLFIQSEYG